MRFKYSRQIAQLLFHKSLHPKISSGDFYAVLFNDCIIEGEVVNALGLYKFDIQQQFIKSGYQNEQHSLTIEKGILQKKIDKGAIIFDLNQSSGCKVLLTDKKNSQGEARFWANEFLKIKPIATSFSATQNYLNLAKQFATNRLAEEVEVSKADQIDLLNKSVIYFKTHDQFNEEEFANELLGDNENALASFKKFKSTYQESQDVQFSDDFEISDIAVKKTAKVFKRVIKLGKNFDVHIHGDRDLIERGVDPVSGRKFYKIYFDQES